MRNGRIFYHFKRKEEKKSINNVFGVGIRRFVSFLYFILWSERKGKVRT